MNKRKGMVLRKMWFKQEELRIIGDYLRVNNLYSVGLIIKDIVERGDFL